MGRAQGASPTNTPLVKARLYGPRTPIRVPEFPRRRLGGDSGGSSVSAIVANALPKAGMVARQRGPADRGVAARALSTPTTVSRRPGSRHACRSQATASPQAGSRHRRADESRPPDRHARDLAVGIVTRPATTWAHPRLRRLARAGPGHPGGPTEVHPPGSPGGGDLSGGPRGAVSPSRHARRTSGARMGTLRFLAASARLGYPGRDGGPAGRGPARNWRS